MSLHIDLAAFDGKGLAPLEDIRRRYEPTEDVLRLLVELVGADDKNVQTGASWLIRSYLVDGASLTATNVGRLAETLGELPDGFGRLHICQAMDAITVPEEHVDAFADFFRSCEGTENTFLRAWAPHGLYQLALQHQELHAEARSWVERALSDPAPSVRARARKTLAGE